MLFKLFSFHSFPYNLKIILTTSRFNCWCSCSVLPDHWSAVYRVPHRLIINSWFVRVFLDQTISIEMTLLVQWQKFHPCVPNYYKPNYSVDLHRLITLPTEPLWGSCIYLTDNRHTNGCTCNDFLVSRILFRYMRHCTNIWWRSRLSSMSHIEPLLRWQSTKLRVIPLP